MSYALTSEQRDRAAGILLGTACGDALGAGYEFGPPLPDGAEVRMRGGGAFAWEPGEWTDDTSMAIPLLRAAARGDRFDDPDVLAGIVREWVAWAADAPDVGTQTRAVLGRLGGDATEQLARRSSEHVHDVSGRSGGNGSLMRTAPLVLGFLGEGDSEALAAAARRISELTHWEDDAGDACVIWCLAIRHAVLTGEADLRVGIAALPEERRDRWTSLVRAAEEAQPRDFYSNGWCVQALQGAWSALAGATSLQDALERAVRGGRDTDTVAAIAGGLGGALYGAASVPDEWRRIVHGWPGLGAADLEALTEQALDAVPA